MTVTLQQVSFLFCVSGLASVCHNAVCVYVCVSSYVIKSDS